MNAENKTARKERFYMTEEQAADYLRVTKRVLRDWRVRGALDNTGTPPPRSYKRGKHIFYERGELDTWISDGLCD